MAHGKPSKVLTPLAQRLKALPLLDFIPEVSPACVRPTHFAQISDALEDAKKGGHRICFSAPRQHGKTTLIKHSFPWWHLQDPTSRLFYATYSSSYTQYQSRDIRRIYQAAQVGIDPSYNTLDGWRLVGGGDLTASSVEGRANGFGANIIVVDDPFSGPDQAYSRKRRDEVFNWYSQVLVPMLAPGGSLFIIASRWDEDDLSGRLIKEHGYDEICIPAINERGEPLCPDGPNPNEPRNLEFLLEIKEGRLRPDGTRKGGIGIAAWSALYQGKPLPPGGGLFKGSRRWTGPMPQMVRVMIGLDLAYSTGAGSDFTAAVVLGEDGTGNTYVLEALRMQQSITSIEEEVRRLQAKYPGSRTVSYVSGAEKAIIEMLFHRGVLVEGVPARWSKLYRSQRSAAAWNAGAVYVPADHPSLEWLDVFLHELAYFSGVNDGHDDQVDALVSAFDAMEASRPIAEFAGGQFTFGAPCL